MALSDDKTNKSLINRTIHSLFAHGLLNKDDLSSSYTGVLEKVLSILDTTNLVAVIDHRDDILKNAYLFVAAKEYTYAKIFFAMFFEHSLNAIITHECERRKMGKKMKNDVIRSSDIHGKLTWLPFVLGLKQINHRHVSTIKKIADDRNAFIHYKWNEDPDVDEAVFEKEIKEIKLTIRYIKNYESGILYKKSKGKLSKVLRNQNKSEKVDECLLPSLPK